MKYTHFTISLKVKEFEKINKRDYHIKTLGEFLGIEFRQKNLTLLRLGALRYILVNKTLV